MLCLPVGKQVVGVETRVRGGRFNSMLPYLL